MAQVVSQSGDTPALYGGSKDKQLVDKEAAPFLRTESGKGGGLLRCPERRPYLQVERRHSDRTLPSSAAYFDELIPLMLTRDTRVTNHGYRRQADATPVGAAEGADGAGESVRRAAGTLRMR